MESKGFLFTVIPLVVIIFVFGYLNVQQESKSDVSLASNDLCKTIEYNGEDRIDILFISSEEEARHYTEVLLSTEPYKSQRNYFNTYAITDREVKCKDYKGIAILCSTQEVQDLAKQCPHAYIFVVKQEPSNIRSSAYGNILSINSIHDDSVLIHEFGHAFGNLAEEYGGAKIPFGSKNCVSSCQDFKGAIDSCEVECSESSYHRSIPSGVMRTLATSNYGIYNKALLITLLEKNKPKDSIVTGKQIAEEIQCDSPLVGIELTQNSDGTIVNSDNILVNGCAVDKSGEGALCFNDNCYPNVIFTDAQDISTQEEIDGEVFAPEEPLTFYVEQNPLDSSVEVTINNQLIETINTAQAGATACRI